MRRYLPFILIFFLPLVADEWIFDEPEPPRTLAHDLMLVDWVNCLINERMPVTYNHLLQGGYINMPSARMSCEGELGLGYAYVPPYRIYSARAQLTPHIEVSGNYRVFRGVDDPILSPFGFGDLSDKGANVKFAIVHPEDSDYRLPGFAFGFEDFLGTRSFKSAYAVMTQVFLEQSVEVSLGIGRERIRGLFGGALWMPFRRGGNSLLEGLSLVAEYDATPYESPTREPHPDGRVKKSSINVGAKYRLFDHFDFSASYIRGDAFAFSASAFYNFGETKGFLPKLEDPLLYQCPKVLEPLGPWRPEQAMVRDFLYPFRDQGFDLMGVWLTVDGCGEKVLQLKVYNYYYRYESDVRCRLNHLLSCLVPCDISRIIVVIESEGIVSHEYHYAGRYLEAFREGRISPFELALLSPIRNVTAPLCGSIDLFSKGHDWWNFEVLPMTITLFGSATGKFKGIYGLYFGLNGHLYSDVYYSVLIGWKMWADLYDVKDVDRLNPSQIINVRTDEINYYKATDLIIEEAYLQKCWHLGGGWYTRAAAGLFEPAYGGLAGELLYYPVCSNWAVGIEGAHLRKRTYDGLGFVDTVRKLDGFEPTYQKFNGYQYFANLYYHVDWVDLDVHLKAGKFLAHDTGVRYELSRYFESGLRINFWYTRTNKRDYINGERYYDKGVSITLPLDIFYSHSSRNRWEYGMSAWLRDVGQIAANGVSLYKLLFDMRE